MYSYSSSFKMPGLSSKAFGDSELEKMTFRRDNDDAQWVIVSRHLNQLTVTFGGDRPLIEIPGSPGTRSPRPRGLSLHVLRPPQPSADLGAARTAACSSSGPSSPRRSCCRPTRTWRTRSTSRRRTTATSPSAARCKQLGPARARTLLDVGAYCGYFLDVAREARLPRRRAWSCRAGRRRRRGPGLHRAREPWPSGAAAGSHTTSSRCGTWSSTSGIRATS